MSSNIRVNYQCLDLMFKTVTAGGYNLDAVVVLTDEVISILKKTVSTYSEDDEIKETIEATADIVQRLAGNNSDITIKQILSDYKLSISDPDTYNDIEEEIQTMLERDSDGDDETLKKTINFLRGRLKTWLLTQKGADDLYKLAGKLQAAVIGSDVERATALIDETQMRLDLLVNNVASRDTNQIKMLDFDDSVSIKDTIENMLNQELEDGAARLTSGSKKFDEAICGSFKKGKLVMWNALQYKNKSGLLRSVLTGIAINNYPEIEPSQAQKGVYYKDNNDGTKTLVDSSGKETEHERKPLILKISFEDEIEEDVKFLYKYFMMLDKNETISDFDKLDVAQVTAYVKERIQVTGYHFKIIRATPSSSSFRSIIDTCEEFNNNGYRVDVLGLDYLNLVSNEGCQQGATGDDVMDKFRHIRDYVSTHDILCITPHQLRTAAKDLLASEGITDRNFAKALNGRGESSGSRSLDRELDLLFNIHILQHTDDVFYQNIFVEKVKGNIINPRKNNLYIRFYNDTPLIITDDTVSYTLPVT